MRPSLFASAATILLGALLLTGAALADEPLLRGPRKAVRVSAEAADSATGGPGAMEGIAAAPVRFYQRFLAPHWGNRCAHHPSCSHYALLAIRKHGAAVGLVMTFDRLQHESNEARYSPLIRIGGETKVHDPLENNDYWWYRADRSEPAVHGDD